MPELGVPSFSTFGELLKYLRKRAQLTQRDLAVAVGYTEGHISRLEQNQRPPDLATVAALFIPALGLEEESETVAQLMKLAARAHGDQLAIGEHIAISRVQETTQIIESVEDIPSNLPIQLTTFIGRQNELRGLTELLSGKNRSRLVTLTGPGGIGKTRLALQTVIQLSHLYPDGSWFVDLAPLSSPELVPPTVASALSVAETGDQSVEENLISYLRSKQILIVIDNCEHLIRATAQFAEKILRSCVHVQLLATSRELLHIPGEVNFRVPPLSLPEEQDGVSQAVIRREAVQLFIERARNTQPDFALTDSNASIIARICRQLDGMPLAIELAAARTSLLSLGQIEVRLKDRFQLLRGGSTSLPRHQTLRATIEWSHDLLSEAERILFRRLSVFAGGWSLDAANSVCTDSMNDVLDLLAGLVNKSLVVVERAADGEVRYRMLETIREYAAERLRTAGEREGLRARHFDYFFTMAQQAEPQLFREESSIDWAEAEIDNLRAALTWALEREAGGDSTEERTGRALDVILHVWPLWLNRGYSIEGSEWLNQLLLVHQEPTLARARALLLAGDFAGFRGDALGKMRLIQEALALAKRLGDKKRIAWALMEMGLIERDRHSPEATEFLNESLELFQELNETLWVCRTSFLLAETLTESGDLQAARRFWRQGLDLCRAENDQWQMGWGLHGLGDLERLEGHLDQALQLYRESLQRRVSLRDKLGITYALTSFAQLASTQGQFRRAATLWGAAEKLGESLNLFLFSPGDQLHTAGIPDTRAGLGEEAFRSAWEEGRALRMHQAIDYALTTAED